MDLLAVLDADIAAMSVHRGLEAWMPPNKHVVLCERFHNGEVMAGFYIVRNSAHGRR